MKKPTQYDLKKWLCENTIVGLRLYYYQTGTESSTTDWALIPIKGKPKRTKAERVRDLVDLTPDWVRVLQVKDSVLEEVEEYKKFAKKEAKDLATYERLKKKFEGV